MLNILLGYKSHDTNETPDVLYIGHDGDELENKRDKAPAKYIRLSRISGAIEFPAPKQDKVEKAVEDTFKEVDQASESIADTEDTESDAEDILTGSGVPARNRRRR